MKLSLNDSYLELLMWGSLLALLKLVYLFFDPYNILDFVAFMCAGMILNKRLHMKRWPQGVLISVPAVLLCFLFLFNIDYVSISNGIGTTYLIH